MSAARVLSGRRLFAVSAAVGALAGISLAAAPRPGRTIPNVLTSRPQPATPVVEALAVGEAVRTGATQRRRLRLPDGSALYVNRNTRLTLAARDRIELASGEVFVEVAPRTGPDLLVVKTPRREVKARGTKFAVRADAVGTNVLVASGEVRVSGLDEPMRGGQMLPAGADAPKPAPRVSHLLGWTRDLMAAADAALVPASAHPGGSLLARDPDGQEAKLALRRYHIDVYIEGGFARTTIDQTYFNHSTERLEGTFYFPLPPDASLSRLAMYVDGKRMEGGMAERDYARGVYETILYQQRDPALLEWLDGSTFKMRVFPLEGRQEKRVILSYTQKLPALYGQASYRFPAGHSLDRVGRWSFHARLKAGAAYEWASPTHALATKKDGADLILTAEAKDAALDRDVVLEWGDPAPAEDAAAFAATEQDGAKYLLVRYRPALAGGRVRPRRDWVFLVESSGDRDPLLARTQIEVVRSLLANADPEDTFAVLTAGTRTRSLGPARPVTPANADEAVRWLEGAHLVGALDLGRALAEARPLLEAAKAPHLVHVGSGVAAMGERRQDVLVKWLPAATRYVGVGVGRRWNRALMKAAAEATAGYFTQVNPDEPLAWRGFELAATLDTPRLLDISVADKAGAATFLPFARLAAQGEEVAAVCRVEGKLPTAVVVKGTLGGKPFERELKVEKGAGEAVYLPRTWARLEIERLLAEDAAKHRKRIVELSKAMYVLTPFTSLLVLENEEMYQQFKVDRGRKDHWAMYDCPERIKVVYEPLDGEVADLSGNRASARSVARTIVKRRKLTGEYDGGIWRLSLASGHPDRDGRSNDRIGLQPVRVFGVGLSDRSSELEELLEKQYRWQDIDTDRRVTLESLLEQLAKATGVTFEINERAFQSAALDNPRECLVVAEAPIAGGTYSLATRLKRILARVPVPDGGAAYLVRGDTIEITTPRFRIADRAVRGQLLARRVFPALGPGEITGGLTNAVTVYAQLGPRAGGPGLGGLQLGGIQLGGVQIGGGQIATRVSMGLGGRGFGGRASSDGEKAPDGLAQDVKELIRDFIPNPDAVGESLLHQRPAFGGEDWQFSDLLARAPGLNTQTADEHAVVEAEAGPMPGQRPGKIDAGARALFAKARAAGWRAFTRPGENGGPALKITFDGCGRYTHQRTLPSGLRERVLCDGDTLWHAYPDLGLAARRAVSRFHRLDFAAAVPWALPRPEDLARGADLRLVGDRAVAVVPHGTRKKDKDGKILPHVEMRFRFDAEGRLAELRAVSMPAGELLAKARLAADGRVEITDGEGKEVETWNGKLAPVEAPDLKARLEELVVLDLPFRTREHVLKTYKIEKKRYADLTFRQATALLAADVAAGNAASALEVLEQGLVGRGQKALGYYVLLAAAGQNLDSEHGDVLGAHPDEPLAQYLALHTSPVLRRHASQWAAGSNAWPEGFLKRLATAHALLQRWQVGKGPGATPAQRRAGRRRALEFVRREKGSALGWALLGLVQDRTAEDDAERKLDVRAAYAAIAEAYRQFEGSSRLGDLARYERARCLLRAGDAAGARKLFAQLHAQTFKDGGLLRIDADFRKALLGGAGADGWGGLMRQTAAALVKQNKRAVALTLARQCWQLDDRPLAQALYGLAMDDLPDGKERLSLQLAGLEFLWQSGQLARADRLLRQVLAVPANAQVADLWRLGYRLAEQRDQPARQLECLERALEAEYRDPPPVLNLLTMRAEYEKLLGHYDSLARALATLRQPAPSGFVAKVVRAADRWRALDRDGAAACTQAARVLQTLGERELAWDYLTTPVALRPAEAEPWSEMAGELRRRGELTLADRALRAAFEAEPTNAQFLWDRAENLRQAGRLAAARALYRQLAEAAWQPRFAGLQEQARWRLER
jgi:ferric-dicitrate binding protein FerR (iron transport regulator)